jgi:hypothetical protein
MHFQLALCEPCLKRSLDGLCFLLGSAVHQPVVCIPTPREVRMYPLHPQIKGVMQEEI